MTRTGGAAGEGQAIDRLCDILSGPTEGGTRRGWFFRVATATLSLSPRALQARSPAHAAAALEELADSFATDSSKAALPARALIRLGSVKLRLYGFIRAIAFTPDGRFIAGADDGPGPRVAIFDVKTGRKVGQLIVSGKRVGMIESVAISPDGAHLLWGESDGHVALWDLPGKRLLFRERMHGGDVVGVAFSPDGTLMASEGGEAVRLQRVEKPSACLRNFTTQPTQVPRPIKVPNDDEHQIGGWEGFGCLAFTPDGSRLVGGYRRDATLFVWRARIGEILRKILNAHGKPGGMGDTPLQSVAVTPDGPNSCRSGDRHDFAKRPTSRSAPKRCPCARSASGTSKPASALADHHGDEDCGWGYAALSNDGRHVAVADFCRLCILEAETGTTERTITIPGDVAMASGVLA